jgi:hypothetical protein
MKKICIVGAMVVIVMLLTVPIHPAAAQSSIQQQKDQILKELNITSLQGLKQKLTPLTQAGLNISKISTIVMLASIMFVTLNVATKMFNLPPGLMTIYYLAMVLISSLLINSLP